MLEYEKRLQAKGFKCIAGLDESGRGPLAGPVVAACVVLKTTKFDVKIYDSKALSKKQRQTAYAQIIKSSYYSIGIIDHKKIDHINIYQATARAMEKAIHSLGLKPDFLLVDGKVPIISTYNTDFIIKGDQKSLSIACASIIAKVIRDNLMKEYDQKYPEYGFAKHQGYGTKSHMLAINKFGPCPIHRRTFAPIKYM